jgi:type III secretory pathway component EscR
MKRYLTGLLLSAALMTPVLADHDRGKHKGQNRYYDRSSRDWHDWNKDEEKAYKEYLKQQRKDQRAWDKLNRKQQHEYWKWRHKNPGPFQYR